ncbi:hypothetical protein E2C01_072636 [Portunus trituberculatus]|uniref:Uncharacterized protein n=1 Tax=Portunus trituberculatus TaxID=210409 RepID=A0A5B7IBV7_PORTR|nr:hypothetical protein [Portunus trituberculatus]
MRRRGKRSDEWCLLVRRGKKFSKRLSEWKSFFFFFTVLEGVEEKRGKVGGDDVRRADDSLSAGKILVVGDSQVSHLDLGFCARARKWRSRECLHAAGFERVSAQLDTCLADRTKP